MKRIVAVFVTGLVLSLGGFAAEQKTLSKKEVRELIAKANTPAEHQRLADYYTTEAKRLEAEAEDHADMAKAYRANPHVSETKRPGATDTIGHCDSLSESLKKAAADAKALAATHAEMAKAAKK
jgi:hypothetical protein